MGQWLRVMWRVSEEMICVRVGSLRCYALDSFDVSHVVYMFVSLPCVLCPVSLCDVCCISASPVLSPALCVTVLSALCSRWQRTVPRTTVVELDGCPRSASAGLRVALF